MKIRMTLKDPDGISDSINDEASRQIAKIKEADALNALDEHDLRDQLVEKIDGQIRKWVRYSEYVDIEIDTEAGTARVIEQTS